MEPEAKLAFVIRIRGLNKIHPKVRRDSSGSLAEWRAKCIKGAFKD